MSLPVLSRAFVIWICLFWGNLLWAETFRVVTYNVENYLLHESPGREAKSKEAKAAIVEILLACQPDVLALQEIGGEAALTELQALLKQRGLDLPHSDIVRGFDTNIQTAVLSRFAIVGRRPHVKESFLLRGRRFRLTRGINEVDVRVNANYAFTLLNVHLKSKRASAVADEDDMRLEEAKILREIVDARLAASASSNLVVLGDFNDSKDSRTMRTIFGRGASRMVDLRPGERAGEAQTNGRSSREIVWTHYFAKEDSYSRLDYILVSGGMQHEWRPGESSIVTAPNWGVASDHRPLLATFVGEER